MITHEFRTIIGEIPNDWDAMELRHLLLDQSAGDWGNEDGEVGIKIIRSTNFTNAGHLDFSDVAVRYFSERAIKSFGLINVAIKTSMSYICCHGYARWPQTFGR